MIKRIVSWIKPKVITKHGTEEVEFVIHCKMRSRWVPHFLGMLRYMQQLGGLGGSRNITFRSDGDGDFRPKFQWHESLKSDAEPVRDNNGNRFYDAG
jgi:hypothetical protein